MIATGWQHMFGSDLRVLYSIVYDVFQPAVTSTSERVALFVRFVYLFVNGVKCFR